MIFLLTNVVKNLIYDPRISQEFIHHQWWIQGGAGPCVRLLPLRTKIFLFSFSFWENLANLYVGTPPPEDWRPLLWGILDPHLIISRAEQTMSYYFVIFVVREVYFRWRSVRRQTLYHAPLNLMFI